MSAAESRLPWWVTYPASRFAQATAQPAPVIPGTPLDPTDPAHVQAFKTCLCNALRIAHGAELEPQGDFGHQPMDVAELAEHLRDRIAATERLDLIELTTRELQTLLDAIQGVSVAGVSHRWGAA